MSPRMMAVVLSSMGETVSYFTKATKEESRKLKGGKAWDMSDDDQVEEMVEYVNWCSKV